MHKYAYRPEQVQFRLGLLDVLDPAGGAGHHVWLAEVLVESPQNIVEDLPDVRIVGGDSYILRCVLRQHLVEEGLLDP
jgi:hypothetical protein